MAMGSDGKFMDAYKRLETAMRAAGTEYKEYEDKAPDVEAGRLRISRQMRNYMAHFDDSGFLFPSGKQIAFLEKEACMFEESGDVLGHYVKSVRSACCDWDDMVFDVLSKMAVSGRTEIAVVKNGKFAGVITVWRLVSAYLAAARPKTLRISGAGEISKDVPVCSRTALMDDVPADCLVLCTSDGTWDGRPVGVRIP